jgi:hypothetical protein
MSALPLPQITMLAIAGIVLIALAAINVVQLKVLIQLQRRVGEVERVNARLDQFAQALTLLTDTTEQGLENVAGGLQSLGRRIATRGGTRATGRRIADAVRGGRPLSAIAAEEEMSESEVRLHMGLHQAGIRLAAAQGTGVPKASGFAAAGAAVKAAASFDRDQLREEEAWQAVSTSR